jgi:RNA polymerase sigma-70 factor (ECF subfamily)|tara:strand:+ start:237 stop:794 length:558 start_codon:yes stop_codon:yes gene_type:complete
LDLNHLIEKCKKGDRKAQQLVYNLFKDKLYALCLKYCKNKDEAQDNLQDSFISIFQKINTYSGKGSFEGWLKRITINKAIDRYKREPYLEPIDYHQVAQDDTTIDDKDLGIDLNQMLLFIQELPDRYRLVFNMYELDNYSHREISQILEVSEGTSKSNLHRAKVILKQKITAFMATQKNSIANGY